MQNKIEKDSYRQRWKIPKASWLSIPLAPILTAQIEISRFRRELLIRLYKDGNYNNQSIRKMEQELDRDDLSLNEVLMRGEE